MALTDNLESLIMDLDAAIEKEKTDSEARIALLRARKVILRQAQSVLTPDIEKAFKVLKSAGVL